MTQNGSQNSSEPSVSFTAYSGAENIPEDFASMSAVRAGRNARTATGGNDAGRRGRMLLLLAALGVSLSLAWQQAGDRLLAAASTHVNLPVIQWPERIIPEGPWLDRSFRSVRIDTLLSRLREDEIRAVLAGHLDQGYFSLDVNRLRTELESHPWVSRATVRKDWPDGLTVSVREHRPIARWGEDALINLQGEIFGEGDLRDAVSLPRLEGPVDSSADMMRQYQQFSQMLQPASLRISTLRLGDRGSWFLVLENGTAITVGREELVERMQRFTALYLQEWSDDDRVLATVDLRYDSGLAVRFSDSPLEAVAALSQGEQQ